MTDSDDSANADKPDPSFVTLEAIARVEVENGRWVVYLNVQSWEPQDDEHPITNDCKRINDYSSESDANVAAAWYQRSANKSIRAPKGF